MTREEEELDLIKYLPSRIPIVMISFTEPEDKIHEEFIRNIPLGSSLYIRPGYEWPYIGKHDKNEVIKKMDLNTGCFVEFIVGDMIRRRSIEYRKLSCTELDVLDKLLGIEATLPF